ncbi:MAG: carbohydrate ABC transporter permease [Chloroflexota bacterium]
MLIFLSILFLIPFYIIVRNALSTRAEITAYNWVWFPSQPQWGNFFALFNDKTASMWTGLRNSAVIATVNVAGQLIIASMAGYALACIPYRRSNQVLYVILTPMMIPGIITFIPTFAIVSSIGWVNTLQGLIVLGLFNVFATFVFRQFYLDFPREIEDAGRVDGLGYWGIYRQIVLPNSQVEFISLGILAFVGSWNSFLWPLVIGQFASSRTRQIVLSTFLTAQKVNLPELFMGAAVGIAPVMILFLLLQRYIVQGVKLT